MQNYLKKSLLFFFQSNKCIILAGVFSPEFASNTDNEYAHLFGNGFEKVEWEGEDAGIDMEFP